MSCYYPSLAVDYGVNFDTGKHIIKFLSPGADFNINLLRSKYGESLLLLPCGKCLGCKFDKSRDWAIRAVLEMQYHDKNCFVTLTYDDENLPIDFNIHKSHVQSFIKALRNDGYVFSYLAAGELGEESRRPHYHLCLFGYCPQDLELFSKSGKDNLYTSVYLSKVWNRGNVLIGNLSFESAGYVARYTTKKVGDDNAFLLCSNRPGIGYRYLVDNYDSILETGQVYGEFGHSSSMPIPRYFDRFIRDDPRYEKLKNGILRNIRIKDASKLLNLKFANLEELKIHESDILDSKISKYERKVV